MVTDNWDAEIEEFLDTLPPLPVLPYDALARESMYDGDVQPQLLIV